MIVAVRGVGHEPARLIALDDGHGAVAVAVGVVVRVPGGDVGGIGLVDVAIAVVVRAVAGLDPAGVDAGVTVVAVARVFGVAIAVLVGGVGLLVDVAVAVVVATVGVLGGARVDAVVDVGAVGLAFGVVVEVVVEHVARRGVVAVGRVRHVARGHGAGHGRVGRIAVAVAVRIRVERGSVGGGVLVGHAVAVVVDAVAVLGGAGVDIRVVGVAVGGVRQVVGRLFAGVLAGGRISVAVDVEVGVPGAGVDRGRGIGGAVAVVIEAVAGLGGGRADTPVPVVTVRRVSHVARRGRAVDDRDGDVTVAVGVAVRVPGRGVDGGGLIHGAIAVLVGQAVADFTRAGVDAGVGVVAVGRVGHEARRLVAGDLAHGGIAEGVGVAVRVPGAGVHGVGLVDGRIAVVVEAVAGLAGAEVDRRVGVVAVVGVVHVAGGHGTGFGRGARAPLPVAVRVRVERGGHRFVDVAVAVLVRDAVADFARAGVDAGIGVVAVGRVGHVAGRDVVAVGVEDGGAAVAVAVAVEVDDADFGRGVGVRVAVGVGVRVGLIDRGVELGAFLVEKTTAGEDEGERKQVSSHDCLRAGVGL